MEAAFTFHPDDPPGDHYLVSAPKEEWLLLLLDLRYALNNPNPVTEKLISELESWGM